MTTQVTSPPVPVPAAAVPDAALRWRMRRIAVGALLVALCFVQAPGRVVGDTKLDLTQDPAGFLDRALHLWDGSGFAGQVQNQAYGYLFPIGPLHLLGEAAGLPDWVVQRLWWSVLLLVAWSGILALASRLEIGSPGTQLLAGVAYALSPRIVSTLGPVSAEAWPMALAPWVVVPLVAAARGGDYRRPALLSALVVAAMGGVNAALTLAAILPALLFLLTRRPGARWLRLTAWWGVAVTLVSLWWLLPLLLLGRYSPPFLDYIESAGTTTAPTSLLEALRGTSHWVAFLGPDLGSPWRAGTDLALTPILIVDTVLVVAIGMYGLCLRRLPERGWLVTCLVAGAVLLTLGHTGDMTGFLAGDVRSMLDGALAPLRNVHKFDPLVRIPLVLGLAHGVHLMQQALERRRRSGEPGSEVLTWSLAGVCVVAVLGSAAPALAGRIAPAGSFETIPGYWHQAADWVDANADGRVLLVPGSRFATYLWGNPNDEPLQALTDAPWEVRNAIPLVPAGHIRMLDTVERSLASGQPSASLAAYLTRAGIGHLVVRNDLRQTPRLTSPAEVHAVLDHSPGISRVAHFGPVITTSATGDGLIVPRTRAPAYPAVEIYSVRGDPSPVTAVPMEDVQSVTGGPESLLDVAEAGLLGAGPTVLAAQQPSWLTSDHRVLTDGLRRRLVDFGLSLDNATRTLAADDPSGWRPQEDYALTSDTRWRSVLVWLGARDVRVSSSRADLGTWPSPVQSAGPAAAFDGSVATAWLAAERDPTPTLTVRFAEALVPGRLTATVPGAARRSVRSVLVATDGGIEEAPVGRRGTVQVDLVDPTATVRIQPVPGLSGVPVGLAEVSFGEVDVRSAIAPPPLDLAGSARDDIVLTAAPGYRSGCLEVDPVVCDPGLPRTGEDDALISRLIQVEGTDDFTLAGRAAARPGRALDRLLSSALADGVTVRTSSQLVPDSRSGPASLVDGDPRTAWTAGDRDRRPRIRLTLPQTEPVTGLRLQVDPELTASFPSRVAVTLRGEEYERRVRPDGTVPLPDVRTDRIALAIEETVPTFSITDPGRATVVPVGISELTVRTTDGVAGPAFDDRQRIELPCGSGPDVTVDGRPVATAVAADVQTLRQRLPVDLRVCDTDALVLTPGQHLVTLAGSALWRPVQVSLVDASAPTFDAVVEQVDTEIIGWDDTQRTVVLGERSTPVLLTVRENSNTGWRATLHGKPLDTVVVDGWQQGYVVPAGPAAEVRLSYTPDRLYRAGLFGGFGVLALVAAAALVLPRRRSELPAAEPVRLPWWLVGATFAALAGTFLAGVAGLVAATIVIVVRRLRAPEPDDAVVDRWAVAALATTMAAGLVLAWSRRTEPVDPHEALTQVLGVTALALVVAAGLARRTSGGPGHDGGDS